MKPIQKSSLLKGFLLPRILHSLMGTRVTKDLLGSLDKINRQYTKKILHLHLHTPNELIQAPVREGGLGVCELSVSVPQILLRRLDGLRDRAADDPIVMAMLASGRIDGFRTRLRKMLAHFPEGGHKQLVEQGVFSRELNAASQDSSSRSWIDAKPAGSICKRQTFHR